MAYHKAKEGAYWKGNQIDLEYILAPIAINQLLDHTGTYKKILVHYIRYVVIQQKNLTILKYVSQIQE